MIDVKLDDRITTLTGSEVSSLIFAIQDGTMGEMGEAARLFDARLAATLGTIALEVEALRKEVAELRSIMALHTSSRSL